MAKEKRLYKSTADYSIKKKHVLSSMGDIYESDHLTISPFDELFADQEMIYSTSNFKFSQRIASNMQKKHSRGNWLQHDKCEGSDDYIWTVDCMNSTYITPETKIKLKPNYNSIKDFAYYGSAQELITSTINNIIINFPAELFFSKKKKTVVDIINGSKLEYYIIDNDFDINLYATSVNESGLQNPMRYFALNYHSYNFITTNGEYGISKWVVENYNNDSCENLIKGVITAKIVLFYQNNSNQTKNITIYLYQTQDKKLLLYNDLSLMGLSIRPNKEIIEDYFNNIDEFEGILLNRTTNPIYKATFDTPYETEYGIKTKKVHYIWPNINNWNPVIKTSSFTMYFDKLMDVAVFHDEYDSDNIWRSMTHEAIKNLDWTYKKVTDNNVEDLSVIDTSRISKLLRLYGRQYDDVKRYIDNIKTVNSITYDERNNIPDYSLTDTCDINGWDVVNLNISSNNINRTPVLYSGMVQGYTSSDANTTFMRRLQINSKYILSKKGTRSAIDIIMGLFGFDNTEYEIKEYINIAHPNSEGYKSFNGGTVSNIIKYPIADNVKNINSGRNDGVFNMININPYYKLPVREISVLNNENPDAYISYIVPWFSKGIKYDNDLYFQMYGGWGKQNEKDINLEIAPSIKKITSEDGLRLYDETESYLKFTKTISDMVTLGGLIVKKGDICYVTDLSEIDSLYKFKDENEKNNVGDFSHYFILVNDNLLNCAGYNMDAKDYGWKNISLTEIENGSSLYGKKVLYLESIIDEVKGNNPHIGRNSYDDGQAYLDGMANIFDYALKNNLFTLYNDNETDIISDYKFELVECEDNRKSWYFPDESNNSDLHEMVQVNGKYVKLEDETIKLSVGNDDYATDIRTTQIKPYNPEGGRTNDEAAANSIINTKKMVINFKLNKREKISNETKLFIKSRVLPYIKQVIPSTTIFEYKFSF